MKFKTVIIAALMVCSSTAALAINPTKDKNVNVITDNSEFLKVKKFKTFYFSGCVIRVDQKSGDNYFNILGTKLFTSGNQVTITYDGQRHNIEYEPKEEIVSEYIFRQNYCSHVR